MRSWSSWAMWPVVVVFVVVSTASICFANGSIVFDTRLVFVTSVSGTGNLGDAASWPDNGGFTGLAAADAVCQARASAAGLSRPGDFVAWMSDTGNDAYCRVHGHTGTVAGNCGGLPSLPNFAGPWLRTDGHPFAEVIEEMLDPIGRVYVPARLDEFGTPSLEYHYFTATDGYGVYFASPSAACADWTAAPTDVVIVGGTRTSSHSWSSYGTISCSAVRPLLCMQAGAAAPLPPILNYGALAFVTSIRGQGRLQDWPDADGQLGVAAADAICRSRAAAGGLRWPDQFKAWISSSTENAPDRIGFSGPWVRLDGVVVAQSKTDLLDGEIFGPINQDEYAAYASGLYVLTGTDSSGIWGTEDCSGWSSALSTDFATTGRLNDVMRWADQGYHNQCDRQARLYCLSEVENGPVVFFDGFETNSTAAWTTTFP